MGTPSAEEVVMTPSTPPAGSEVTALDAGGMPSAVDADSAPSAGDAAGTPSAGSAAAAPSAGDAAITLSTLDPPIALGALDGRYRPVVAPLVDYLSEPALNRERIRVEVEWLIHLTSSCVLPGACQLSGEQRAALRRIPQDFGPDQVRELAELERVTVHDVKAVEYFLRRRVAELLPDDPGLRELVHFACTSEDVNNLAYALMVRGAAERVWLPAARDLVAELTSLAHALADVPLLARTHGQPASPTTMGKELAVTAHRLGRQLDRVSRAAYLGKLNGATGTYGAHVVAVPEVDWEQVSREFVEHLGLTWNPLTTQIESHDWQAELYADLARFNRILHGFCQDVWSYISAGYFAQSRGQGTVGSSTMPHKVNPIRFENAEANLEVADALLDVLAATLVQSRLQRDLSDSSMQRNIGSAFGHSLLAVDNVRRGLAGLDPVPDVMAADLDGRWEVLAEPVQSALRALAAQGRSDVADPYEQLKALTRGQGVTREVLHDFVRSLGLPDDVQQRLLELTPVGYVGLAPQLVRHLDGRPD